MSWREPPEVQAVDPPRRESSRPLLRFFVLWAACVLALGVVYGLAVRTEVGQRFDDGALAGRALAPPDALRAASDLLDTISVTSLALGGAALVLFALARARVRLALGVATSLAGAVLTTEALKRVVLERPALLEETHFTNNSLPSGHATVAMALAVGGVLAVPRRLRATTALLGVVYAAAIGVATLTAGWHRPSDAIAGYAVAVGWGAGVAGVLVAWRGVGSAPTGSRRSAPVGALLALVGTAVLVATLVGLVLVLGSTRGSDLFVVDRGAEFAAGALAIGGSALVGIGALVRTLRGVSLDPRPAQAVVVGPPPVEGSGGSH